MFRNYAATAAAKSLLSCPTLCDPIDGSPPGSAIPGILQARTLEWVATSFSNAWKWKVKVKVKSCPTLSDPMDCSLPGSLVDWPQTVGAANIPNQDQYVLELRNNCGYGFIPALRRVQASQGDKRIQTHERVRQLGTAKPSAKCGKALWSLRQPEMALEEE